tara:strand:- start:904 stop:1377 length:474 start_codon:yes stop_codon:yes gene_type:complete
MIHGVYGSNVVAYLSLEENRINNNVHKDKIYHLFKFTNDMLGTVKYVYGAKNIHNDRYVKYTFSHNTTDNVFSTINFNPFGYWSYEVYEVSWVGSVSINDTNAPNSETEVLTVNDNNGVVQGLVHKGKLLIQETAGQEQIKYTQYTENTTTNYLYTD